MLGEFLHATEHFITVCDRHPRLQIDPSPIQDFARKLRYYYDPEVAAQWDQAAPTLGDLGAAFLASRDVFERLRKDVVTERKAAFARDRARPIQQMIPKGFVPVDIKKWLAENPTYADMNRRTRARALKGMRWVYRNKTWYRPTSRQ